MLRPRLRWQPLRSPDPTWWTPGWLPDTDVLRTSLAAALRVEDGMSAGQAYAQVDYLTVREAYVAEDEGGEWIEVSPLGVDEVDGNSYVDFQSATLARLDEVQV